jgi:uncharacterized protein (DUF1499 family)
MKFTNNVEFWLNAPVSVIHVRPARRLEKKDFNVNQERIEQIRAQFTSD